MQFSFEANRPLDLICLGRVLVDLYAEQIGSKLKSAQTFRKYLGGCAGNIAIGTARLGLKSSMLSCVGHDEMGQFILDTLNGEGVDVSFMQITKKHLTALVLLGIDPPHNFPLIFYRNDCADLYIDINKITKEYLNSAKAILITGTGLSNIYSKETLLFAINLAKETNTKIILDIDYRPVLWGLTDKGDGENRYIESQEVFNAYYKILDKIDLIVGTKEEFKIASNNNIKNIRSKTDALIVVKKGDEGCEIFLDDLDKPINIKPYPVKVLNVLGAGDAFMSGLLYGILNGHTILEAGKIANAAGAIVVTRHGCAPAMPSIEEIKHFQEHNLTKKLQVLHRKTIYKNYQKSTFMPILAFCHRSILEESCIKFNQSFDKIKIFKKAIVNGLLLAIKKFDIINPYIIIDPKYGEDALDIIKDKNIKVFMAIEDGDQLIESKSAYEILLTRNACFYVKFLWHPEKDLKLKLLKEVFLACTKLERYLVLEIILPEDELINTINKIYQNDIFPDIFKIPGFKNLFPWQKLCQSLDEYDKDAKIVILGGEHKDLESFTQSFKIAKSTKHGIGFAIGRSLFWAWWLDFLKDKIALEDISKNICEDYYKLYKIWISA